MSGILDFIQDIVSYRFLRGPQFHLKTGLGITGIAGFWLGVVMGLHIGLLLVGAVIKYYLEIHIEHTDTLIHWSIYMILLCYFHIMEFYSVAVYNPRELSFDSFLINHSKTYTLAVLCSWVEFFLETFFFDDLKHNKYTIAIGLVLVFVGQMIRTWAMATCGDNFSHVIMNSRKQDHQLVTTGIYAVFRHPSYFGWFYWSIGTQLVLCNPICTVMYTLASWYFFSSRIPYEEQLLVDFYRETYLLYMQRTIIGIPFISSKSLRFLQYRINLKE